MTAMGVGIIGAGVISGTYLENLTRSPEVEVRFISDLDTERAAAQAQAFGVPHSGTVEQLLERDDVDVVVNLTIPAAHAEVGRRIVAAGKHVWSEKPLALDRDSARDLLAAGEAAGVRVACAPDTLLGPGIQTALRAIHRGDIGEPLTATTMFHVAGPERWHPSPDFLYAPGGGPLLDMGPYYLTTLALALGPATRVHAVASTARPERTIAKGPRAGESFPVLVPSHHAALIEYAGGRSAQSVFSFQHAFVRTGVVEINGTEGTLVLPDPNGFGGDSALWRAGDKEPTVLAAGEPTFGRGAGVIDLVRSIRAGEPERASGALALHVLDVMLGIGEAAAAGGPVEVATTFDPVPTLPEGWDPTS